MQPGFYFYGMTCELAHEDINIKIKERVMHEYDPPLQYRSRLTLRGSCEAQHLSILTDLLPLSLLSHSLQTGSFAIPTYNVGI
jgi:hypothetical protein